MFRDIFYCLEESMDIFRQYYGVMIYKPLYRVCLTFLKCSNNWWFCYVLKLYNVAADALWKETGVAWGQALGSFKCLFKAFGQLPSHFNFLLPIDINFSSYLTSDMWTFICTTMCKYTYIHRYLIFQVFIFSTYPRSKRRKINHSLKNQQRVCLLQASWQK